jgi:hypothetical protein
MPKAKPTEQDRIDQRQRLASLRKTIAGIQRALLNSRGLERLRLVSDEDWQGAEERDKDDNENSR